MKFLSDSSLRSVSRSSQPLWPASPHLFVQRGSFVFSLLVPRAPSRFPPSLHAKKPTLVPRQATIRLARHPRPCGTQASGTGIGGGGQMEGVRRGGGKERACLPQDIICPCVAYYYEPSAWETGCAGSPMRGGHGHGRMDSSSRQNPCCVTNRQLAFFPSRAHPSLLCACSFCFSNFPLFPRAACRSAEPVTANCRHLNFALASPHRPDGGNCPQAPAPLPKTTN